MYLKRAINSKLTTRLQAFLWFIIWCALILTSWYCRPLLPFQETQIASTTWEMWQSGTWLVPLNNGEINPQTPPLLNWIEIGMWSIFGPHEFLLRLTTASLSFGTLLLTALAARQLWPTDRKVRALAPLVLIGSFVWILFATAHVNQIALSFFQILCINFLIRIWQHHWLWWAGFGVAFLLGLLSSGAGFILYIIPFALSYSFWGPPNRLTRWYIGLAITTFSSLLFFILWAYIAYLRFPDANMSHLLGFSQLFYRINDPMPIGFYLFTLPFILFPWALWPPLYRNFRKATIDPALKFCIFWALSLLIVTALIGTNPTTPLLPVYPVIAILIAKTHVQSTTQKQDVILIVFVSMMTGLMLAIMPLLVENHQLPEWIVDVSPFWGIGLIIFSITLYLQAKSTRLHTLTLMSLALVIAINFGVVHQSSLYYDLAPASNVLSKLEQEGFTLAHLGRYQSQYHFAGRLTKPLIVVETQAELMALYAKNQIGDNVGANSKIIFYPTALDNNIKKNADYFQNFRGNYLVIMPLNKFNLIDKSNFLYVEFAWDDVDS